jgi:hypothetical protein
VELAALPQCIRGFGHVKWKALEEAGTRSTALHASLRRVT